MRPLLIAFAVVHGLMAALFAIAALVLTGVAALALWEAAQGGLVPQAAQTIIEAVGVLAAAVVALQIAQTIAEEEVVRMAQVSAPTRVRRFLSRFLVVLVVALVIEGLVMTLKALHERPADMLYSAALIVASGVLLASWGWFVRMNRYAEELEPQALAAATAEDRKVQ
jgi:hypothetical protein